MAHVRCTQDGARSIMCDNQRRMLLAKNPTHHSHTKHINVQYHFIQEKLESGIIERKYCRTDIMAAKVVTKALGRDQHQRLVLVFGLKGFGYTQSGSAEVDDVK